MKQRGNAAPPERGQTLRQSMMHELELAELTAAELGQHVGLREREVVAHLDHLRRSLPRGGKRLLVVAAECRGCGFVFRKRQRLNRPSACPRCRQSRIEPPRFRVVAS